MRRRPLALGLAILAAVCYVPLLLTRPGWVSADTKSYLYLDPGRLLDRAPSMWDSHIGLGTVTHQNIGYLWPMGPWFWAFDRLGAPDWVAQRLWWASILFLAGAGVAYLLRRFDWPPVAILPASYAYALTPFVVTLLGRISGILLPFVGLPWMLALTIQATRNRGWRYPALLALLVATVGSINLTALALVGLAPAAWLVATAVSRHGPPAAEVGRATLRIVVLMIPVNLWWLIGLSVQSTNGIDIVRYTETAEVVSRASSAAEVLRGLGYWFFYGGDRIDPWIAPSTAYTQRAWLLIVTFAVPCLALLSTVVSRWRHRTFFTLMGAGGMLLAIGVFPWADPSVLGRVLRVLLATDRGLAFRSLPRAAPLLVLGLAIGLGAGVGALARARPRAGWPTTIGLACLCVLALPPLWQRQFVGAGLERPEELPDYWHAAIDAVDAGDHSTRVWELPGSDFASYRWGMTVDPITPGLTDRPYVARELVPYGSPASARFVQAVDVALQQRTLQPQAIAPLARLFRAGDLLLRNDLQYERYGTARPRLVSALVGGAGVGPREDFGPPAPNDPVARRQLFDETWLVREAGLPDPSPVSVVSVDDPEPIVAGQAGPGIVMAGDPGGLVDAADAGLLTGRELLRFSASLTPAEMAGAAEDGATLLLTDSNRRRAERWTTVHDIYGYTERADEHPMSEDLSDNRLPVFDDDPDLQTVVQVEGGITAQATSYGNPITYFPAVRPSAAVDGDPRTAWETGDFTDARGQRLRLTLDDPTRTDRLRLLQPSEGGSNRHLTSVRLHFDDGSSQDVALGPESLAGAGQLVTFPMKTIRRVEIELLADTAGQRARYAGFGTVGLAEVRIGDTDDLVAREVVRVPTDLLQGLGDAGADRPLTMLFTRLRTDPTSIASRNDEEPAIVRAVDLPSPRSFTLSGTARLSARADDATIAGILLAQRPDRVTASATSTLQGSLTTRPRSAIDGDPATAWTSRFDRTIGERLTVETASPSATIDHLDLQVVADGRHSVPTGLRISIDGQPVATASIDPDDAVDGLVQVPVAFAPVAASRIDVEVTAVQAVQSTSWDTGELRDHPVAIAEVGIPGVEALALPAAVDPTCRTDVLSIDGTPVPVRIGGSTADGLAGAPLTVTACDGPVDLAAGPHRIETAAGIDGGIDVDQLVFQDGDLQPAPATPPTTKVLADGSDHVRVRVDTPGGDGGWLVLGESFNTGWTASLDGKDLGPPELVDGYANGWRLPAGVEAGDVDLRFTPQRRVDVALVVSVLFAGLCLVLARRKPLPLGWGGDSRPRLNQRTRGPRRGLVPTAAIAAGALVGGTISASALVGVALALVGLVAARSVRGRRLTLLVGPVAAGLGCLYVVVTQHRHAVLPGLEWPAETARFHDLIVFGVLAVALSVVVDQVQWADEPEDQIEASS